MKKLLLVLPFLILISCGVQKRKYQSGYHVTWRKSKLQNEKPVALAESKSTSKVKPEPRTSPGESADLPMEQDLFVSNEKNLTPLNPKQKKQLIGEDPCDELIFNDGTELKVRVTEMSDTEVKYKKCDMPDGPVYVVTKSKLFMVKYASGTKEVFKNQSTPNQNSSIKKNNNLPTKTHPLATVSFVTGIISFFPIIPILFSIVAMITGYIAMKRINANPDVYKGKSFAVMGQIFGLVSLVITILIILILLALA